MKVEQEIQSLEKPINKFQYIEVEDELKRIIIQSIFIFVLFFFNSTSHKIKWLVHQVSFLQAEF
jgi:hypothetical protein